MTRISVTVDGVRYDDDVEPRTLLVHHLRERLGKIGTVVGCDTSNCGACTVLMSDPDGRLVGVKSCSVLAVQADGREVTTIEGLAGPDNTLHPVQKAFHERHALQCGFCTPGMIMAAVDLLQENPDPSEQEIREGLEGNLCRCTGYQNIVRAVRDAAADDPRCRRDRGAGADRRRRPARRRPPTPGCLARQRPTRPYRRRCREGDDMTITEEPPAAAGEVGTPRRRKEDARLITGRTMWTENITLPGMLHLAILRSPMAHARITSIDVSPALEHARRGRRLHRCRRRRRAGRAAVRLAGHRGHRAPRPPAAGRRRGTPHRRGGRRRGRPRPGTRRRRARGDRGRVRAAAGRARHGGGPRRGRRPRARRQGHQQVLHLDLRLGRGRHRRRGRRGPAPRPRSSSSGGTSSSG